MTSWSPLQDVTVAGTSVKNFGYGMRLVGGLDSLPKMRGENVPLAYGLGRMRTVKTVEEEVRTLAMWVDSRHPDGTFPETYADRIRQRNGNLRELFALFGDGTSLVTVTRQMLLPAAYGGDQEWTAQAEADGGITPDWAEDSDEEAFFNVDLTFTDPRWRGPEQTYHLVQGDPALAINNLGTQYANDAVITFNGDAAGIANPQLNRGTAYLRLGVSIAAGDSVVVDVGAATATRTSDGANLIGAVVSSGTREFMRIPVGSSSYTLDGSSGSGSVDIAYRPAFY